MNLTETQPEYQTVLTALEVYAHLPETHPAVRATQDIATDGGVLALDQDELEDFRAIVHTGNATLDHAEFNTVLAALRTYQKVAANGVPGLLTHGQIDDFCERINLAAGDADDLSVSGEPPPPRPSGVVEVGAEIGLPQSIGWAVMPLMDDPYQDTRLYSESRKATHEVLFHNAQLDLSGRFPVVTEIEAAVSRSEILARYYQDRYVPADRDTPGMKTVLETIRASDGPQQVFDLDTAMALDPSSKSHSFNP